MASRGKEYYRLQHQEQYGSDGSAASEDEDNDEEEEAPRTPGSPALDVLADVAAPMKEHKKVHKKVPKKVLAAYRASINDLLVNVENSDSPATVKNYVDAFITSYPPTNKQKKAIEGDQIKRSRSAYNIFYDSVKDKYQSIKQLGAKTQVIAAQWNELEDKSEWNALAEVERKRYEQQMMAVNPEYKPKKIPGPFALFSKELRSVLDPELAAAETASEKTKICRKRWRDLGERDKGEWYAKRARLTANAVDRDHAADANDDDEDDE